MKMNKTMNLSVNANLNKEFEKGYKLGVAKRLASLNTRKIVDQNGIPFNEVPKFPDCGTPENPIIPSWLEKAPLQLVEERIAKQTDARNAYTKELKKLGFAEAKKDIADDYTVYGVEKEGEFYTFSSVSRKNEVGETVYSAEYPLISEWVDTHIKQADHPVINALNDYLQSFWLDEDKFFEKLDGKENAATIMYPNMTVDECQTFQRFMTTIKEVNIRQESNYKEWDFLMRLLNTENEITKKDLQHLGLLLEDDDCTRDKEVIAKKRFLESLSKEQEVLWYFTRKVAKFLSRYDNTIFEILNTKDYRSFGTFEELVYELKVYEGVQKKDENGNPVFRENEEGVKAPCFINAWTYWELFLPQYVAGVFSGADLAIAFFKFSQKAAMYGHTVEEQAGFQFESWAKQRLARMKDYVNGIPGNEDYPPHPQSKNFLEAFAARLIEDEIF